MLKENFPFIDKQIVHHPLHPTIHSIAPPISSIITLAASSTSIHSKVLASEILVLTHLISDNHGIVGESLITQDIEKKILILSIP